MPRAPKLHWDKNRKAFRAQIRGHKKYYHYPRDQHDRAAKEFAADLHAAACDAPNQLIKTVGEMWGRFQEHLQLLVKIGERAPGTLRWYEEKIPSFVTFAQGGALRVDHVTCDTVRQWIAKNYMVHDPTAKDPRPLSDNYRRSLRRAVKQMFRWAAKERLLRDNPLAYLEVGNYSPSQQMINETQWQDILGACPSDEFRDVLLFLRLTGCRVQEIRRIQAVHAVLDDGMPRVQFRRDESPRNKERDKILLRPEAADILRRLVAKYPDGPLFRNTRGEPWNKESLKSQMARIGRKIGWRPQLKALRHVWTTDFLQKGGTISQAAALLGHKTPRMVMQNYSHVAKDEAHLYDALTKHVDGKTIVKPV